METAAARKYHVAPLARQERAVQRLLRAGRFRNLTEFIRSAIDHYLDALGRPSLSQQASQMAEDWERRPRPRREALAQQQRSMKQEDW